MTNLRTITLAAAEKKLAKARELRDVRVCIGAAGSLGQRVYQLEGGIQTRKHAAARNALRLVEAMKAAGLDRVQAVTLTCGEEGFSTVYIARGAVLLIVHSSLDAVDLTFSRKLQLAEILKAGS